MRHLHLSPERRPVELPDGGLMYVMCPARSLIACSGRIAPDPLYGNRMMGQAAGGPRRCESIGTVGRAEMTSLELAPAA
jgi:hypothetical protein